MVQVRTQLCIYLQCPEFSKAASIDRGPVPRGQQGRVTSISVLSHCEIQDRIIQR